MTDLGQLSMRSAQSVTAVRRKVFQVVEEITADPVLGTRLAIQVSHLAKRKLRAGQDVELHLDLRPDTLTLTLRSDDGESELSERVDASQADMEVLQEIVQRKDREELSEELHLKNAELNVGKDIQMSLLPFDFPDRREFSLFATLIPAREVGGDFYDFFFLDEGRICFCVGDVSGKGVPAALLMAVCKTLLKSRASSDASAASTVTFVNDELARNNDSCMFVTLFLVILDIRQGSLLFTNAGHNPPFLLRGGQSPRALAELHGPAVGVMEGVAYEEAELQLRAGDTLFLFTDGLTEAMDAQKRLFSDQRLESWLSRFDPPSVESLVTEAVVEVKAFEAGAPQADDLTVLALQFRSVLEDASSSILIEPSLDELAGVTDWFREFAASQGVDEDATGRVLTCLDELLNNIVRHSGAKSPVEVVASFNETGLSITITDDGKPFNPLEQSTPDLESSLENRKLEDWIHLVENLMDSVQYHREINRNTITITLESKP